MRLRLDPLVPFQADLLVDQLKHTLPLFLLAVAAAWWLPRAGSRVLRVLERAVDGVARRPAIAILAVGALAFVVSAWLGAVRGVPIPYVHDEFGYLLLGDTFAHARMTNPTPPGWQHFETFHQFFRPTYTAKFPPAQGVAIALGDLIDGKPILGVWISTAAAAMALCWMLYAFVPARWALIGGLFAATRPTYQLWARGYWGGAIAVLGGALMLGGLRRLLDGAGRRLPAARTNDLTPYRGPPDGHPRPAARWSGLGAGLAMGAGCALLLNSRPYEGLAFSLVCFGFAIVWMAAGLRSAEPRQRIRQAAMSTAAVLVLAAGAMTYYNWRVTGSALQMPYAHYQELYSHTPPFLWQRLKPLPSYDQPVMRAFYTGDEPAVYERYRHPVYWAAGNAQRMLSICQAFIGPVIFVVPLLAFLAGLRRDRWSRMLLTIGLLFMPALVAETWMLLHYAAPAACLFVAATMVGFRRLAAWRLLGRPTGRCMALGVLAVAALSTLNGLSGIPAAAVATPLFGRERAATLARLERQGGRHIVFVRYDAGHSPHHEWVFNSADIPSQRVIWARSMGQASDGSLAAEYPGRTLWMLDADARPPVLSPYAPARGDGANIAPQSVSMR